MISRVKRWLLVPDIPRFSLFFSFNWNLLVFFFFLEHLFKMKIAFDIFEILSGIKKNLDQFVHGKKNLYKENSIKNLLKEILKRGNSLQLIS